jgi:hypothetical protein
MWPVSDEFKQALVYSHRAVCKVEVWKGGVYQRDLDIVDGQVTVDDQPIRRRISVALTDKTGELEVFGSLTVARSWFLRVSSTSLQ